MKSNKNLNLITGLALTALVLHPCAKSVHAGVAVSLGQNFTGSSSSFAAPPMPSGAASADYFVEFNINQFAVYSKVDGTALQNLNWQDFWNQAGVTIPATYGRYEERVIYDPTVQRWFVAEDVADNNSLTTTYHVLLAVSATADPSGAWNGVSISGDPGGDNYAGWVNMGLDALGVYLSAVAFDNTSGAVVGCTLLSLPKADLLAATPIITNRTWFGILSATNYGYNIKPAVCIEGSAGGDVLGTTGRGIEGDNDHGLIAFAVQNAGGPGSATLSSPKVLSVPAYTAAQQAIQPDGSSNLWIWNAAFTANAYGVGGLLFATDSVQAGDHAAIRWYRVSATNHTLLESGTITDPSLDLWYPSIAANTNGTVVVACNGSGTNTFVSCYAAVGQTINGVTTFGNLLLLQGGAASYQNLDSNGDNLWGYYSTTCVDPTDANVFWTINTFASGPTTWSTQITQLLTSPSPRLSMASTGTNLLVSWPVTLVPFQLQSAPSLTGNGSWPPVTLSGTTNGTTVSVPIPVTNGSAFFRLVQSQ